MALAMSPVRWGPGPHRAIASRSAFCGSDSRSYRDRKKFRSRRLSPFALNHSVRGVPNQRYPAGLSGIAELPNLTHRLLERGYGEDEVTGILGQNRLRTFTRFVG